MKLTPYQRIMRAARRCTGVRLSPDDVQALSMDDAISTVAYNDDEADEEERAADRFGSAPREGGAE